MGFMGFTLKEIINKMKKLRQKCKQEKDKTRKTGNSAGKKYGQGEISVRKCDTCDYEQEIRSDGVHVSAAGAVSVFCDEDEFFCPNSHEVEDVVSICLLFRMFD
jgi:hypothetical protein